MPTPARSRHPLLATTLGYWLVPRHGGGSECWRMRVEPDDDPTTGTLVPDWDHAQWEAALYDHFEQGHTTPFAIAQTTLGFEYRVQGDRTRIGAPSTWRVLSDCSVETDSATLPWFASAEQCQAAASERAPMDFGACGTIVPDYPHIDRGPTRFEKIMARGGTIWERRTEGCIAWKFRARTNRAGRRTVSTTRFDTATGDPVQRESYVYSFQRGRLTRDGPSYTHFVDGKPRPGPRVRCSMIDTVLHDEGPMAKVGDARWYYARADCEASPPAPSPDDRC